MFAVLRPSCVRRRSPRGHRLRSPPSILETCQAFFGMRPAHRARLDVEWKTPRPSPRLQQLCIILTSLPAWTELHEEKDLKSGGRRLEGGGRLGWVEQAAGIICAGGDEQYRPKLHAKTKSVRESTHLTVVNPRAFSAPNVKVS